MTGWAMAWGECVGCGRLFGFNPLRVPSLHWHGERRPVCTSCGVRVYPRRKANGLPPIVPADDAYEPVSEAELP